MGEPARATRRRLSPELLLERLPMRTGLIATLFAVAATAATAQLAAPITPGVDPAVRADPAEHRTGHGRLRADREKVKADKQRLRAARAARDDGAIRAEQATLRADMQAWHADRERRTEHAGEGPRR